MNKIVYLWTIGLFGRKCNFQLLGYSSIIEAIWNSFKKTSEALTQFLQSDDVALMSTEADGELKIKDLVFDFSKIEDYDRMKTIEGIKGKRLIFERCIFTGSLRFKDCQFESIRFKHCQFIKPSFGIEPSSLKSLSFSEVTAKWFTIENSFFERPISIHSGNVKELKFNYVTCPRLWLQSMWNESTSLSIHRFLGRRIYLPSERKFEHLWLDDQILRQVEGNKINVQVKIPGLD
jgi:hypothetical protein